MINIIGLGYIGLPTALMLANKEFEVVGTDINLELIENLQKSKFISNEDGFTELFEHALLNDIKFTNEPVPAGFYIISVPTPFDKETKKVDTIFLENALESVLNNCLPDSIIIIESTIPPGTIHKVLAPKITEKGFKLGENIHLVHAPERIIPGSIIKELHNNPRIIGADDIKIAQKVEKIYKSFCQGEIILTSIEIAEMSKVVENTYRDVNIAFANELLKICNQADINVYDVIKVANMHPRVNILNPGPGVGGHCIPVDPWFLVGDFPTTTKLIKSAREVNDSMPGYVFERIKDIMEDNTTLDIEDIGIYGLAYKENIDDIRESPSLQLLELIQISTGVCVKNFDPFITVKMVNNQYLNFQEFIKNIKLLVIMTAHDHISNNIAELKQLIVLDTKNTPNIYKKESL